jgi:hypothetical protein
LLRFGSCVVCNRPRQELSRSPMIADLSSKVSEHVSILDMQTFFVGVLKQSFGLDFADEVCRVCHLPRGVFCTSDHRT